MKNLNSKKFILAVLVAICLTIAYCFSLATKGDFTTEIFISSILGISAIYNGSNFAEKRYIK